MTCLFCGISWMGADRVFDVLDFVYFINDNDNTSR